jgi:hypothetical protein
MVKGVLSGMAGEKETLDSLLSRVSFFEEKILLRASMSDTSFSKRHIGSGSREKRPKKVAVLHPRHFWILGIFQPLVGGYLLSFYDNQ